jgi:hypothetical protein
MSTAVCTVMCSEPAIRAPARGLLSAVTRAQRHEARHLVFGQTHTVVAEQVDHHGAAARLEHAGHLVERATGVLEIAEGQHHESGIHRGVVKGQRFETAGTKVDVLIGRRALLRGLEHGRRLIDADDLVHVGGDASGENPGTAAEIGHRPVRGDEAQQRRVVERVAV